MKPLILSLFTVLISFSSYADPRSFEMTLRGVGGSPLDPAAEAGLFRIIGDLVAKGYVKKFIVMDPLPFSQPGLHVCIDPMEPHGYNGIMSEIQVYSFGGSAIWDIQLVDACEKAPYIVPSIVKNQTASRVREL